MYKRHSVANIMITHHVQFRHEKNHTNVRNKQQPSNSDELVNLHVDAVWACIKFKINQMRSNPWTSRLCANFSLAAWDGWNPSQNTYSVAFEHVPIDLSLQRYDVSSVPVPQQAFLDSKNPATLTFIVCVYIYCNFQSGKIPFQSRIYSAGINVTIFRGLCDEV